MTRTAHALMIVILVLLAGGVPHVVEGEASLPKVINLYPKGPRPQTLKVAAGTTVIWVSHLAHSNLVVATVSFHDGQRVAQVTSPVAGYNGFVFEAGHFVGRMEGSGGKVALRFNTPGEYTYTLDHQEQLTGMVVVHH